MTMIMFMVISIHTGVIIKVIIINTLVHIAIFMFITLMNYSGPYVKQAANEVAEANKKRYEEQAGSLFFVIVGFRGLGFNSV